MTRKIKKHDPLPGIKIRGTFRESFSRPHPVNKLIVKRRRLQSSSSVESLELNDHHTVEMCPDVFTDRLVGRRRSVPRKSIIPEQHNTLSELSRRVSIMSNDYKL